MMRQLILMYQFLSFKSLELIKVQDNYKVVCFSPKAADCNLAGRHLDQRFPEDPLRPVDMFLR